MNTYARSQCTGCIFCPNVIEDAADDRLLTVDAFFASSSISQGRTMAGQTFPTSTA